MSEKVIHFDNARETQDVTGKRGEFLPRIEKAFNLRLTSRDTWLRMEGDESALQEATRFFECMRKARNTGTSLREHSIVFALQAFRDGRQDELDRLFDSRIDVGPGKPPVFPRTFGQHRYVEAIRTRDIVFGIGPAGTGKTYLAMAMAIAALLKNEVSRIILTRPAVEAGESIGFLPGVTGTQQRILLSDHYAVLLREDHPLARGRGQSGTMALDDLRQAIALRELEGLSYEEIARRMNCPIGTVRSRIFRAREAIAAELRPLLDTPENKRW